MNTAGNCVANLTRMVEPAQMALYFDLVLAEYREKHDRALLAFRLEFLADAIDTGSAVVLLPSPTGKTILPCTAKLGAEPKLSAKSLAFRTDQ